MDPILERYQALEDKIKEYNPALDAQRLFRAFTYADNAHAGQLRKDGSPYITHPLAVAEIVAELELDTDSIIAALLHDCIEDTGATHEEIAKLFGATVADLVEGVTKLTRVQYTSKEEEQMENLRKMLMAMAKDIRVILIKICDRLHNMRTMEYQSARKQKEKALETMEIYAPIAHRLGMQRIKWELEDTSLQYLDPIGYREIADELAARSSAHEEFLAGIQKRIQDRLDEEGIRCTIYGRVKHIYSIYRKMYTQNKTMDEIFDLYAFRVIVDDMPECYNVLGVIHDLFNPVLGRFKDYISTPKPNGYQSLHTTVVASSGQPLEIQIRTFEMHKVSEYGVAAHWRYKESGGSKMPSSSDKSVDAKMAWLRQLLEWHKDMRDPHEFVDTVKMDVFSDEVFVFTPQGDVLDLPEGSVPIDFAYRVHTGVGNSCVGAKVNGKIVPLDYHLKNGDIVEIITSKQSPGPSRDWINIVGSSQTKNKIKQFFKKERREENIVNGREMLERECRRLGYDVNTMLTPDNLKEVASRCHMDGSVENLLAALGYGGLMVNGVMVKLVDLYKKAQRQTTTKNLSQLLSELKPKTVKTHKGSHGILVKGEDDIMVKLAKCCNPIPGDPIVGYITRGHGVSVHRADCPNVLSNTEDPNRMIEVSWNVDTDVAYKVVLRLTAVDQPGVMANIMTVASETKVNINSINAHTNPNKTAYVDMGLDISSLDQLNYIIGRLRRIKGVYKVDRKVSGM